MWRQRRRRVSVRNKMYRRRPSRPRRCRPVQARRAMLRSRPIQRRSPMTKLWSSRRRNASPIRQRYFPGLDKITGRIISFDVAINETVQFGALQVTPRVCYSRPPTETPNTDAFVEVDEVTLQGEIKRIFTGWMFAASPGLHAVEHPIYDVWLTECKGGQNPNVAEVPADQKPSARQPQQQPQQPPAAPHIAAATAAARAAAARLLPAAGALITRGCEELRALLRR